jgi:hypothetical protein
MLHRAGQVHLGTMDSMDEENVLRLQITTFTQPIALVLHRLRALKHSKH